MVSPSTSFRPSQVEPSIISAYGKPDSPVGISHTVSGNCSSKACRSEAKIPLLRGFAINTQVEQARPLHSVEAFRYIKSSYPKMFGAGVQPLPQQGGRALHPLTSSSASFFISASGFFKSASLFNFMLCLGMVKR